MERVATAEAERAARDADRVRLEVAAAVKSAYADLYRADGTVAILDETRSVLQAFAQTARRRYEVGQGSQENILKAETEILRLEAERARLEQVRRTAEIRLSAAVGRSFDAPLGTVASLPAGDLPADHAALVEAAVAASPEVGAVEAAVRREEAAVRLARLDLKPDLIWSASYQNRGGLDPMVTGMFGLRLPIHKQRRQAQALRQAESSLEAARRELEEGQVRVRAAVRELLARCQRASRLLTLFGEGLIPQAQMTLDSAQASYGVGRVDFLDLLSDLNTLLNARAERLAQEADLFQALSALEPLVGRELIRVAPPTPSPGGTP
jgi:outer membrane protein TolC